MVARHPGHIAATVGLLLLALVAGLLPVGPLAGLVPAAQAADERFPSTIAIGPRANGYFRAVAAGDLDSDGRLDLFVGLGDKSNDGAINGCAVLKNMGGSGSARTFASSYFCQDLNYVSDVALADLDNDGDLDAAVARGDAASTEQYQAQVLLNDGQGNFAQAVGLGAPARSTSVAVGDLDGDGDTDVVIGAETGQSAIYWNDGGATFSGALNLGGTAEHITDVAAGDLNGDGDLDLVVTGGYFGASTTERFPSYIYTNNGGRSFTQAPLLAAPDSVFSVMLADLDGHNGLDIVIEALHGGDLFLNNGAGNFPTSGSEIGNYFDQVIGTSNAAADLDGDGDLDIVKAGWENAGRYYLNDGSGSFDFSTTASEYALESSGARAMVVADMDEDGHLDIVTVNDLKQSVIHRNTGGGAFPYTGQFGSDTDLIAKVELGDLNGDGNLDVVAGQREQAGRIYLGNGAGGFSAGATFGAAADFTTAIALGDLNGDARLDIVQGRGSAPGVLYLGNGDGTVGPAVPFGRTTSATINEIALGDVNRDGSLDIVVAAGAANVPAASQTASSVYFNDGGGGFYSGPLDCASPPASATCLVDPPNPALALVSVDLIDLDSDGDLDIAAGTVGGAAGNTVFLNDGAGRFPTQARAFEVEGAGRPVVEAADMDGDGDSDLVLAAHLGANYVLINNGAAPPTVRVFDPASYEQRSLELADMDGDGDMDIVTSQFKYDPTYLAPGTSYIYFNDGSGAFPTRRPLGNQSDTIVTIAAADLNHDGLADVVGAGYDIYNLGDPSGKLSSVAINRIARPAGLPDTAPSVTVRRPVLTAEAGAGSTPQRLDGRAITVSYTLRDPESDPVAQVRAFYSLDRGGSWRPAVPAAGTSTTRLTTSPAGVTHEFVWDTFASGVFGQSDAVVFRVDALPGGLPRANRALGPYQRPFSAGVSQPFRVRGGQVRVVRAGDAPAPGATVYRIPAGQSIGDPIIGGDGAPARSDVQGYIPGRGTLGHGDRLIALLPIESTEKFTRYLTSAAVGAAGPSFSTISEAGVQTLAISQANPLLAINLTVSLEWDARNDPLYLDQLKSDLRRASELLYIWSDGQIALGTITIAHDKQGWADADVQVYASNSLRPNANQGGIVRDDRADPSNPAVVYERGQIRVGAVWTRHGDSSGQAGEDWPRAFAHELGHWALFLDEDYLGFGAGNSLVTVEGCASPMADPYRSDYGEFRAATPAACQPTLNQQISGRSNWATIKTFYDSPALGWALNAPASYAPSSGPNLLPFTLTTIREVSPAGAAAPPLTAPFFSLRSSSGTRYLASGGARAVLFSADGTRITDLGVPERGEVNARGARLGDRLCVFDLDEQHLGCETISAGDLQLTMEQRAGWTPELLVTPVTSSTYQIAVNNLPDGLALRAKLYSSEGGPSEVVTLARVGGAYSASVNLARPILSGALQVWVEEGGTRREVVSDYALGGNPAPPNKPKKRKGKNAPALSPDGQVVLFSDSLSFSPGSYYAIQSLTSLPVPAPAWAVPVGYGYRLLASANAPSLVGTSLNVSYLESDVAPGTEGGIGMYFLPEGGARWRRLTTRLDPRVNEISAAAQGPGTYALMSSVDLRAGWNIVSYPWPDRTLPVAEALDLLNGAGDFTTVYGHAREDRADPWKVYAPGAPDYVNDLTSITYGQGYWVNVVRGTGVATSAGATLSASLPTPPATYYTSLAEREGFALRAGQRVVALVDGAPCAETTTRQVTSGGETKVIFVVDVPAATSTATAGCGLSGRRVTFEVDGAPFPARFAWDNSRPVDLDAEPMIVYLPAVRR